MKPSKPLCALILIASALFLSAGKSPAQNSGGPSQSLPQQRNNAPQGNQSYSGEWTGTWTANPDNGKPSAKESGENSNQNTSPLWKIWEWIIGISAQGFFNFITALATGVIAWYTVKLTGVTNEMKEATKAAADAARLALHANRPYLLLSQIDEEPHKDTLLGKQHPISRARVSFHNYGSGPAEVVRIIATSWKFEGTSGTEPAWAKLIASEPRKLHIPIVGGDQEIGPFFVEIHWTSDDIDLVNGGLKQVAIYGLVEYRGDAPTEPYYTRFFWWFCPITLPKLQKAASPELNDRT